MNPDYWINKLQLVPHPEGGFYRETYRSLSTIPGNMLTEFDAPRNVSTAIYFLLPSGKFSAFHTIKSDELWFYHAGSGLLIYSLDKQKGLQTHRLGLDIEKGEAPQVVVPAKTWFGAEVEKPDSYALVSCTVAPGFDFMDFEMADREKLSTLFPSSKVLIEKLTYQ